MCIALALYMTGQVSIEKDTGRRPIMTVNSAPPTMHNGLPTHWWNSPQIEHQKNFSSAYQACRMEWGAPGAEMGIVDLAALSWNVYAADSEEFQRLLDASFAGAKYLNGMPEVISTNPGDEYAHVPRWITTRLPGRENGRDTIVVAVKGTSTEYDAYTDASMFAIIAVLQMFNHISPLLQSLPTGLIGNLMRHLRLPQTWRGERRIFGQLTDDIQRLRGVYPNASFVITGHSLGGGIAQTAGALIDTHSVSFSPPGIRYSHQRFGVKLSALHRNMVGIVPHKDIVPKIDRQAGMIQHIACRNKDGSKAMFALCHSMERTACELWRVCGDHRERDFTTACAQYVDPSMVGKVYLSSWMDS
eukprot:gnl/TRDRNA2_/TRDRNA2_96201_c0_seq2.p1 gnl/TRDRNA2_/TRDRNA2_96201_c0~~gnl/TRDRNA2_/TRDRNA2_96201_c0_seq2.p1  ORF type:complete len:409 (-),score=34.21 gnl/TRDRNA2_/TRDRNA2_96201_c0_seq2:63-1139(-)